MTSFFGWNRKPNQLLVGPGGLPRRTLPPMAHMLFMRRIIWTQRWAVTSMPSASCNASLAPVHPGFQCDVHPCCAQKGPPTGHRVQRLLTAGADIAEDVALPRGAEYLAAAHGGGRAVTTQTRLETLGGVRCWRCARRRKQLLGRWWARGLFPLLSHLHCEACPSVCSAERIKG